MASDVSTISVPEINLMARAVASSGLFGIKTADQALALMLIAQAEGRHPALAARDYDIIQNKPAKKSEAMLRDFLQAGGKVEWHTISDVLSDATFSHPEGGSIRISWDMERAKTAGLGGKEMWKKYPRQMLRARVVSEGIRTVYPMATSGMYVPEEVRDFDNKKPEIPEASYTEVEPSPPVESPASDVPRTPEDEVRFKLAEESEDFVREIDMADTPDKLEATVKRFIKTTLGLIKHLPKRHAKIVSILDAKRQMFSVSEAAE